MKVNTLSLKKKFLFITLSLLLMYAIFFMICYQIQKVPFVYDPVVCKTYYMLIYVLLSACAYGIDTQKRKDPAFLSCFALPLYSMFYLFFCFMTAEMNFVWISLMILIVAIVEVALYFAYTKLLPRIVKVNHLYGTVVFLFVIVLLTITLYTGLTFLG